MKYMLLMYFDEKVAQGFTPEEYQTANQAWRAFGEELQAAGVYEANNGLSPVSTATTVRVRDGKNIIADGPFAETHEQLGGYYLLNCKDLDEAIGWAAKIPSAQYGTVEIRPLWGQQ
jgi:hypothetical protein